jgi:hypothetical protein
MALERLLIFLEDGREKPRPGNELRTMKSRDVLIGAFLGGLLVILIVDHDSEKPSSVCPDPWSLPAGQPDNIMSR